MRTVKLTFSADPALVRDAKKLAEREGTSLSSMVSRFLEAVLRRESGSDRPGPVTRRATGLAKFPPGRSDRELLEAALEERYF